MCKHACRHIETLPVRISILELYEQGGSKRPTKEATRLYIVPLVLQGGIKNNVIYPSGHRILRFETEMVEIRA